MSNDKDLENQVPDDPAADVPAADETAAVPADPADDEIVDDPAPAEEEFFDDGDFVEEDWEDYDDEYDMGDGAEAPAKKKSSLFNIIVIVGGVALGLGVLVVSMGGDPAGDAQQAALPTTPPPQQYSAANNQIPAQDQSAYGREEPDDEESLGGFMNDEDALDELQRRQEEAYYGEDGAGYYYTDPPEVPDPTPQVVDNDLPMPAPISAAQQREENFNQPLVPMPGQEASDIDDLGTENINTEQSVSAGLPSANDIMRPATQSETQNAGQVSDTQIPRDPFSDDGAVESTDSGMMSSSASAPGDDVLQALDQKLDMIFDRLDSVEEQISALDQQSAGGADLSEIKKSIKALEGRVDKLARTPVTTTSKPAVSKPKVSSSVAPRTSSSSSAKWVLKSAQPGKAMVAMQGSSETYSVSVGDSLPGIGRITAVQQEAGRWVVQGASGRITQ